MKIFLLILLTLMITINCYGEGEWSVNDYTNDDKAKLDAIFVTGGSEGDDIADANGLFPEGDTFAVMRIKDNGDRETVGSWAGGAS